MNIKSLNKFASLGLAALALALSSNIARAASDITIGPAGTEATLSNNDGEWQNMWGPAFAAISFDAANPPSSGDTQGSVYIQGNWTGSGQDNYCIGSAGNWWGAVTFDASQYASIELDLKYDTNSTITPTSQAHLNIGFDAGYNFQQVTNVSFDKASQSITDGQWHHLSIAIPATQSGISAVHSVAFYQWNPSAAGTMNFWVANAVVKARIVPVAPPTVSVPTKAVQGLNVFASTEGNSFYDRQEAMLRQSSGLTWVGHATPANPVTYSFTIAGYPSSQNCEAYLFLVPNPAGVESSPDWNEATCAVVELQGGPNNATLSFNYKTNQISGNSSYVDLGSVSPATGGVLGTWTVTFTSDTALALKAPDGTTTNLTLPSVASPYFAETTGFNVYLGMQANNADAMNQAVVYSNVAISGNASPYSENFLADSSLDTVNTWNTSVAGGPAGVLIVPATGKSWITWTLPDSGFGLQTSPTLNNPLAWTTPTTGPIFSLFGKRAQLLASSEIPAGNTAFFDLIKRTFTQLQVLLPGEVNAPNTPTGKTGTPTAQSVGGLFNVTVNACDATWHIVSSTDTVVLNSATDSSVGNTLPGNALVGGTVQVPFYFDTAGSQTVTATDNTTLTIPTATSSSVTAQ